MLGCEVLILHPFSSRGKLNCPRAQGSTWGVGISIQVNQAQTPIFNLGIHCCWVPEDAQGPLSLPKEVWEDFWLFLLLKSRFSLKNTSVHVDLPWHRAQYWKREKVPLWVGYSPLFFFFLIQV